MSDPQCPTDCSTELPEVAFSECAPTLLNGQSTDMFWSLEPFQSITDVGEWTTRLNQSGSNATDVRHLTVIGDMPAPEITEKTISHNRKVTTKKDRTFNYIIDDLTDANYNMTRTLSCGGSIRMWFVAGGYIFGGNQGILATMDANPIIPNASEELQNITGTAKWTDKFPPERVLFPLDSDQFNI